MIPVQYLKMNTIITSRGKQVPLALPFLGTLTTRRRRDSKEDQLLCSSSCNDATRVRAELTGNAVWGCTKGFAINHVRHLALFWTPMGGRHVVRNRTVLALHRWHLGLGKWLFLIFWWFTDKCLEHKTVLRWKHVFVWTLDFCSFPSWAKHCLPILSNFI